MKSFKLRLPSPAMGVAMLALIVATCGTGYAALRLPRNSVGSAQLRRNSVTGKKVRNRSLTASDFAANQLPAGPIGPQGPKGDAGPSGADGSPDTPNQVLDKLKTVDGTGSALDADLLDGLHASSFLGVGAKAADADHLDGFDSTAFLPATGKAANADKLDNIDSTGFAKISANLTADIGGFTLSAHFCADLDIPLSGADVGDMPLVQPAANATVPSALIVEGLYVGTAGHLTLRVCNASGASISETAQPYHFFLLH